MTGTVVKIFFSRGFFFIKGEEDGLSRFVHVADVVPRVAFDTLHEGQRVEFTPVDEQVTEKGNGLRAIEVKPCR